MTTRRAASSAGNPRHDFAAVSDDNASHTPSEAIISLPPVLDNFTGMNQSQLEVKGQNKTRKMK